MISRYLFVYNDCDTGLEVINSDDSLEFLKKKMQGRDGYIAEVIYSFKTPPPHTSVTTEISWPNRRELPL